MMSVEAERASKMPGKYALKCGHDSPATSRYSFGDSTIIRTNSLDNVVIALKLEIEEERR